MANKLKCENCGYLWKEEWEEYPSCHWTDGHGEGSLYGTPWDIAPCEEDYWEEDDPNYDDEYFRHEDGYATEDDYYGSERW